MFDPAPPAADAESWAWAQRVIREVTEEAASQERNARDFIQIWVRWKEMVGFINFAGLAIMRRGGISRSERGWHETLVSGLVSLGGILRDWAARFPAETLDLAGYSTGELETLLASLREDYDLWHQPRPPKRLDAIAKLLPE